MLIDPARSPIKKSTPSPVPKHGAHEKYQPPKIEPSGLPADPEDPLQEPMSDPEHLPWPSEEDRELLRETDDPDAPASI